MVITILNQKFPSHLRVLTKRKNMFRHLFAEMELLTLHILIVVQTEVEVNIVVQMEPIILIAVITMDEVLTVAQMEPIIHLARFQLNHHERPRDNLSVEMELMILPILIVVLTVVEDNIVVPMEQVILIAVITMDEVLTVAQMEPIIHPAKSQLNHQEQLQDNHCAEMEPLILHILIVAPTADEDNIVAQMELTINTAVQMEQIMLNAHFQRLLQ
jgi:hypothetical protein